MVLIRSSGVESSSVACSILSIIKQEKRLCKSCNITLVPHRFLTPHVVLFVSSVSASSFTFPHFLRVRSMNTLTSVTIKTKLTGSFLLLTMMIIAVGAFSYQRALQLGKNGELMYETNLKPIAVTSKLAENFQRSRVNLRDVLLARTPEERQKYIAITAEIRAEMDGFIASYEPLITSGEERLAFNEFRGHLTEFRALRQRVFALDEQGRRAEILDVVEQQCQSLSNKTVNCLLKIVDLNKDMAERSNAENHASIEQLQIVAILAIGAGVLASILLGVLIIRSVTRPLEALHVVNQHLIHGELSKIQIDTNGTDEFAQLAAAKKTVVQTLQNVMSELQSLTTAAAEGNLSKRADESRFKGDYRNILQAVNSTLDSVTQPIHETSKILSVMAEGNFQQRVHGTYKGDYAILQQSLNATLSEINMLLGQVLSTVDQVHTGSQQVAASSQHLSNGATQQAAALEEISSSMHEITSQTRTNAENASQAKVLATQSRHSAENGHAQMQELTLAMDDINVSSQNIAKIIKVIDEIAFQTNLLALNAAVEAARAGRHGKGFAVVAEEVRALAGRSAKAAQETAGLIESAVAKAAHGTDTAAQARRALDDIMSFSTKVQDIVGEIASSSQEQAQGISQITIGLSQIDKVTQQNTASAEESASAAEELSGQSMQLRGLVSRFKIQHTGSLAQAPQNNTNTHRANSNGNAYTSRRSANTSPNGAAHHFVKTMPPMPLQETVTDTGILGAGKPKMLASNSRHDVIALDDSEFGRY
ncbi:MAG: methyl-accepting chemotaxis protein [Candidatus Kapaibacterium sp.]|nr:MAG: methyl-accepting chemotaxis protein [Candidatus Kapabacteria bacterium]